jgi:hypothetical protein
LFHDSNGGPATPPPIGQNGGGGGGDTDPPPVTPPKTVTRISYTNTANRYSSEGQKPNINGIAPVYIWYSDGGVDILADNDAVNANLKTVPAILNRGNAGELATPGAAVATGASVQDIYVYHTAYPGQALTPVKIPGVRPLLGVTADSAGVGKNYTTNSGDLRYAVNGNSGTGISVVGSLTKSDYFEDDDPPADFAGITVLVRYAAAKDSAGAEVTDATTGGAKTPDDVWETLPLTQDYIFTDYKAGFTTATPGKAWAYGIDPSGASDPISGKSSGTVSILLSKSPVQHGNTTNESVYITVPFDKSKYHYVRGIDLARPLAWNTTYKSVNYPFLIQTALSGRDNAGWVTALVGAGITLRVSYWDFADTKDRSPEHFRRAAALGKAGVVNTGLPAFLDPESEDFGLLAIGYYASALDNTNPRDQVNVGDFTNVKFETVPIATPVEDSGKFDFQDKAYPKEQLELISYWPSPLPANAPANSPVTSGRLEDAQLKLLQNTYNFVMDFAYQSQTVPAYSVIPGEDFRRGFFTTANPFYMRVGSEIEEREVTFRVPRTEAAILTALETATNAATKATRYALVANQEATLTVTLYPPEYDRQ